jgi:hypothetical protein
MFRTTDRSLYQGRQHGCYSRKKDNLIRYRVAGECSQLTDVRAASLQRVRSKVKEEVAEHLTSICDKQPSQATTCITRSQGVSPKSILE